MQLNRPGICQTIKPCNASEINSHRDVMLRGKDVKIFILLLQVLRRRSRVQVLRRLVDLSLLIIL